MYISSYLIVLLEVHTYDMKHSEIEIVSCNKKTVDGLGPKADCRGIPKVRSTT
jgi:hypothetical protein